MTRHARAKTTRNMQPGQIRDGSPGSALRCLLLAPFPDFVALDMATGALVRAAPSARHGLTGHGGPLAPVVVTLDEESEAWDPSRPEAIAVRRLDAGTPPSRRSVRRLLGQIVAPPGERGLLGSVGPSLAYADLTGLRPSVQLIAPVGGRVWLSRGESSSAVHFRLGEREHALPVAPGAEQWAHPASTGGRPRHRRKAARDVPSAARPLRSKRGRAMSGASGLGIGIPVELAPPLFLTVGLDLPRHGQVRKVVLGIVPSP